MRRHSLIQHLTHSYFLFLIKKAKNIFIKWEQSYSLIYLPFFSFPVKELETFVRLFNRSLLYSMERLLKSDTLCFFLCIYRNWKSLPFKENFHHFTSRSCKQLIEYVFLNFLHSTKLLKWRECLTKPTCTTWP